MVRMFDFTDYVVALMGVLAAIPAAYFSAKKRVQTELHKRLEQISGGQLSTIEDLVELALTEKRLRQQTPIAVYGPEKLWGELRKGGFAGSLDQSRLSGEAKVAVVDVEGVEEDLVPKLTEPYVLIYKEGPPYRGPLPPGALVTYANSSITLDARLMEALRHMDARREALGRSA